MPVNNQSSDARTGLLPKEIRQSILDHLFYTLGRTTAMAGLNDWYRAVAYAIRDRLMKNWVDALQRYETGDTKMVGYLSAEFLMGPHLGNALACLDIQDAVREAVSGLGLDLRQIINQEEEPGLGNGGLGRLAACYLDSMTTLGVPAIGYGIRYEYGIFDQRIEHGSQVEVSDKWLRFGNPWEIEQLELNYLVKFGGSTRSFRDGNGKYHVQWVPDFQVRGIAFDTPVPGFRNRQVNLLRLWKSEATEAFDFSLFNQGNYAGAVQKQTEAETITRILYPNDDPEEGKRLRLMQQYFFVSCSLQNLLHVHVMRGLPIQSLPSSAALQMNDTHPSIAVAELMRLLVDEHHLGWDESWQITQRTFAYTNHTLLPEALEKWPIDLFRSLLPRHLEIILEINHHFLEDARRRFPGDEEMIGRLSIVDEIGSRSIRMANLAAAGSHTINGVSALHSALLRKDLLHDVDILSPGKIINITNGVTPRRWLYLYNPQLSALITDAIGPRWITHLETELDKLRPLADDSSFREKWLEIKHRNKHRLVKHIFRHTGMQTNPDTLFDVQVKRIHEYKRQHLNLLHVITLYNRLLKNPALDIVPRTFIFGGKAAPGYRMAKDIIRLIHAVAEKVNHEPVAAGKLQVIFFPDYNVKNSEWIYRAADLSEQISTAGMEASGTGNMKFSLNGALTIGTLDGANIEIRDAVGADHFFLFGLTAEGVREKKSAGYDPYTYYTANEELREAIDLVRHGYFSGGDKDSFRTMTNSLLGDDPFLVLADYASYVECQEAVSLAYQDRHGWARTSILNMAGMGYFSSDRAVREYCEKVWHVPCTTD